MVAGAKEAGLKQARFFNSSAEAAAAIVDEIVAGDLVLIKGSRGDATDKVVSAIKKAFSEKREGEGRPQDTED